MCLKKNGNHDIVNTERLKSVLIFSKEKAICTVINLKKKQNIHWVKYSSFPKFSGVKILWNSTVFAEFQAIRAKLCRNSAFSQNLHTRKLGKISVFYTVIIDSMIAHNEMVLKSLRPTPETAASEVFRKI